MPASDIQRLTDAAHERGGFAAMRSADDGTETVYELNIALFSAFGGTAKNIPAYLGAHQLMLAFQGIPALYLNAFVGGLNDAGVESTGRTRSINRGHWQLDDLKTILATETNEQSIIFAELNRSLEIRGSQSAFAPSAQQEILAYTKDSLWLKRENTDQVILVIASFSEAPIETELPAGCRIRSAIDLLSEDAVVLTKAVPMAPYQVRWLSIAKT